MTARVASSSLSTLRLSPQGPVRRNRERPTRHPQMLSDSARAGAAPRDGRGGSGSAITVHADDYGDLYADVYAQAPVTAQLTSSAQRLVESKALEPPLLAM